MKFCQPHWDRLRAQIENKGLSHLVAQGGGLAATQLLDQLSSRKVTPENFDPLMGAHWAICANAMEFLNKSGVSPLYLLGDGSGAPEGRNDCPLCELNYLHRTSCTDPKCRLDKDNGYDWMLERAAAEMLDEARRLNLLEEQ